MTGGGVHCDVLEAPGGLLIQNLPVLGALGLWGQEWGLRLCQGLQSPELASDSTDTGSGGLIALRDGRGARVDRGASTEVQRCVAGVSCKIWV